MQTIEQALHLLDYFSERQPEYGLSELAKRAGFDKAKTRRYLMALMKQGLIEQYPATRKYRLGAALLRLARVREACFPIDAVVTPILNEVVAQCGETAHFTLLSGETLGNICVVESPKAHRITMEKGEILPLHATASGLALLAHSPDAFVAAFLKQRLDAFTPTTETAPQKLERKLAQIRKLGIATTSGSYDEGVTSYAMPIRGEQGWAIGALAVAAPSSRIDKRLEEVIVKQLRSGARQIEIAIVGTAAAATDSLQVAGQS